MSILFTVILIAFFIGVVKFGKWLQRYSKHMEQEKQERALLRERSISALEKIAGAVSAPQERANPLENLKEANRELRQKKSLRKAMEDELGIQ